MGIQPFPIEPVRQAINSGEYDRAQLLWNEFTARLAEELNSGNLTEARLSDVRELVEWSRTVILCERAHWQNQLNGLHVAGEYQLDAPAPAHRLVETNC